jgi:hypothetical protein
LHSRDNFQYRFTRKILSDIPTKNLARLRGILLPFHFLQPALEQRFLKGETGMIDKYL